MSSTPRLSSWPPAVADEAAVSAALGWLAAEIETADSPLRRALLLHESGFVQESHGDLTEAARSYLDATNAEPEFQEPLEHLIALLERGGSFKNLGMLYHRLGEIADGTEERARAAVELALHQLDQAADLEGARDELLRAVEVFPSDPLAWTLLDLVAECLDDLELREKALEARIQLSENVHWRGILLVERAQLAVRRENVDDALRHLDRVVKEGSPATDGALQIQERLAAQFGRRDQALRFLEARAAYLEQEGASESEGQASSAARRDLALELADLFLRLGLLRGSQGEAEAAQTALVRARALAPDDLAVVMGALLEAERTNRHEQVIDLGTNAAQQTDGPVAAAFWYRVARAERLREAPDAALSAVQAGLERDPNSVPLHALRLELIAARQDLADSAAWAEEMAPNLNSVSTQAAYQLAAAALWTLSGAMHASRAAAALAAAAELGTDNALLARLGRAYSAHCADESWYERSTEQLTSLSTTDDAERVDLLLELVGLRLTSDRAQTVASLVERLEQCKIGIWPAAILSAWMLPLLAPRTDPEQQPISLDPGTATAALERLEELSDQPTLSRAFELAAALRLRDAKDLNAALERLVRLHRADPANALLAAARVGLALEMKSEIEANEALLEAAAAAEDPGLSAAFALQGALRAARLGHLQAALRGIEVSHKHCPELSAVLEQWILRALSPDDPESRRQFLSGSFEVKPPIRHAIELFALERSMGNELESLVALDSADDESSGALTVAQRLLLGLLGARHPRGTDALAELAEGAPALVSVDHALRYLDALEPSDPSSAEDRLELATQWAMADASLPAQLERWAAATAALHWDDEAAAREAVAARLGGELAVSLDASAKLLRWLTTGSVQPLLPNRSVAARLANVEMSPPGCDPRRRVTALDDLRGCVAPIARSVLDDCIGYNLLAQGRVTEAIVRFKMLVAADQRDVAAWHGLLVAAEVSGNLALRAESLAALGDLALDPGEAAEYWEQAANLLLDELGDEVRGEWALARAVRLDITRDHPFDRLFRRVRERGDAAALLDLILDRLEVAQNVEEIVRLHWERARTLRLLGDRDAALTALESVTALEPDHVGALALQGEIYINLGRYLDAAQCLARLAKLTSAPGKQRLMSGVAAADLYEGKLSDLQQAFEVLLSLHQDGVATQAVQERLAKTAARLSDWRVAVDLLEQLMDERESGAGRAEAARLALAIHRDRLNRSGDAFAATRRLLAERPIDAEAIDLLLSDCFPRAEAEPLLEEGSRALRASLLTDPWQPEQFDRLARIAAWLKDAPTRAICLGVLVGLSEGTPAIEAEIATFDQRTAPIPTTAMSASDFLQVADPDDTGPFVRLFQDLAPLFRDALGPTLASLGVGRKQRVDPRSGLRLRQQVAAWAGALGLGDFDLYLSDSIADWAVGVPGERPSLVVKASVVDLSMGETRLAVTRELYALRRGISLLRNRSTTDIAALVVASCSIGGYRLDSPPYAMIDEFARLLSSVIPRRTKKILAENAAQIEEMALDPMTWIRAALRSLDRMASLATVDVSHVLASITTERGKAPTSVEDRTRCERLMSFVLSDLYLTLRSHLGLDVT